MPENIHPDTDPNNPDNNSGDGGGDPNNGDLAGKGGDGSGEGSNISPEAKDKIALETITSLTGRQFSNVDDAKKHYENLQGFVGQNPKEYIGKAEEAKKFEKETGMTIDAYLDTYRELDDDNKNDLKEKSDYDVTNKRIGSVEKTVEEMNFVKTHPEAFEVIGQLKSVADSQNKRLEDVYNDENSGFKDFAQFKFQKKEEEERAKKNVTSPSSQAFIPSVKKTIDDMSDDEHHDSHVEIQEEILRKKGRR